MSSPLIYKHRQRNPKGFVSSLPTSQWAHKYVLYMGRREGVVKHETLNHGLFGKLDHSSVETCSASYRHSIGKLGVDIGKLDIDDGELDIGIDEFGIIGNIARAADYVKSKVEDGTFLYDNVVSIAKEDFERLGYDDTPEGFDAWQQLVKDNVYVMADKIGIPASRVEYVAALHVEDNKPNLHLLFWDKAQAIRPWYDFRKTASSIRADLIKYVYADDIHALGQAKTSARDAMLEDTKEWNKDKFNPFYHMTKDDFTSLRNEVAANSNASASASVPTSTSAPTPTSTSTSTSTTTNPSASSSTTSAATVGKVLNRNIPNPVLDEMRVKIILLMDKLPQTGRLAFGFLPPAVKAEVQALAEGIISDLAANNPDFKMEFDTYKKSARDLAALYTKGDTPHGKAIHDKAEQNALDDLTKRLANQLLHHIKDIDYNQYLHGREEFGKQRNKAMQRNTTMNLLAKLFRGARQENRRSLSRPHLERVDRIEARRDARRNMEVASNSSWEQDSEQ